MNQNFLKKKVNQNINCNWHMYNNASKHHYSW